MARSRRIDYGKEPHSIPAFILYIFVALIAGGAVCAAALLFPVVVSDTMLILDKVRPRTTVSETLDPQDDAHNNNQITTDNLGASDLAGSSTETQDNLALSDSAQAISASFHQISVMSTLDLLESPSSGISASDVVAIQDKKSLSSTLEDGLSLLDSVGRLFFIDVLDALQISDGTAATEETGEVAVDDDDDRMHDGGGPRRIVYDQSYFENRPLGRMQISGVDTTDRQGRVFTQLREAMDIVISVTARNYQAVDQDYAMFVQITDENGVAVSIIRVTGSIDDGEQAVIEGVGSAQSGSYLASVFLCDGSVNPTVISETFIETLKVK